MKKTAFALGLALVALALQAQSAGQKKLYPGNGIDWKASWEDAVAEAAARNVPIHFTIHKDS
jgi:hypothetical protein